MWRCKRINMRSSQLGELFRAKSPPQGSTGALLVQVCLMPAPNVPSPARINPINAIYNAIVCRYFFQHSPTCKDVAEKHFNWLVVSRTPKQSACDRNNKQVEWHLYMMGLELSELINKVKSVFLTCVSLTHWQTRLRVYGINQVLKIQHVLKGFVKIQPRCYCRLRRDLNSPGREKWEWEMGTSSWI